MGMRRRILLVLLPACAVLGVSAPASKPALQGTWELKSAKWVVDANTAYTVPGNVSGGQLKVYSKGYFLFVGRYTIGDKAQDSYGGGTYALDGQDYSETLLYHTNQEAVGKTLRFKLVVEGDTMTLTGPLGPEGQKALGNQLIEVYVRKD
jgi:hypothetical protein